MAGHEASFFTAVSTMCYRQVKCFLRMRSRLIMTLYLILRKHFTCL